MRGRRARAFDRGPHLLARLLQVAGRKAVRRTACRATTRSIAARRTAWSSGSAQRRLCVESPPLCPEQSWVCASIACCIPDTGMSPRCPPSSFVLDGYLYRRARRIGAPRSGRQFAQRSTQEMRSRERLARRRAPIHSIDPNRIGEAKWQRASAVQLGHRPSSARHGAMIQSPLRRGLSTLASKRRAPLGKGAFQLSSTSPRTTESNQNRRRPTRRGDAHGDRDFPLGDVLAQRLAVGLELHEGATGDRDPPASDGVDEGALVEGRGVLPGEHHQVAGHAGLVEGRACVSRSCRWR